MWPVFPPTQTLALMGIIFALGFFAARVVQPAWSQSRILRAFAFATLVLFLSGMSLWAIGRATDHLGVVHAGAGLAYAGVIVLLPAAIVAPFSAALDRLVTMKRATVAGQETTPSPSLGRQETTPSPSPDRQATTKIDAGSSSSSLLPATLRRQDARAGRHALSRRELLRFGTGSLPAMAAIGSASGFVSAKQAPTMPVIRLRWPDLHPDLDGLRILHLSDLHLGACFGIDRLETALRAARALRPDLIALTGDLADDPSLIPEALALVAGAGARYGALASLGNHEYLHGIEVTRPKYEASAVPLLVAAGTTLRIGRAQLFVGGADDPVHMGGDIPWFLRPSIEAAARAAPNEADFRLLLCHRPEGHGPASENGFDLVLSGHTHGGQLGFLGKSLLERIHPGIGWWGSYARRRPLAETSGSVERGPGGPCRLYTTSGFGHWFPFRLGCPTEMPLIVLEGEPSRPPAQPGMTSLSWNRGQDPTARS